MKGRLSEFTPAELLQLFALSEKTGTVTVDAEEHRSQLFLAAGRVSGWGYPSFDLLSAVLRCELLPESTYAALSAIRPAYGDPGLHFIVRNLLEPHRWDWFVRRLLEQDIYPVLAAERGAFEVNVEHVDTPPVALNLSVQELILDGSRWEADMSELSTEGYPLPGAWRRSAGRVEQAAIELSSATWLIWAALSRPDSIAALAERVGMPDLEAVNAIKLLRQAGLIEPDR